MQTETFKTLIDKYLDETIQPAERQQLSAMLQNPTYVQQLDQLVLEMLTRRSYEFEPDKAIKDSISEFMHKHTQPAAIRPMRRTQSLWKWGWAAAVVFVVCGLWFVVGRRDSEKPDIVQIPAVKDVVPGRIGAVLTLADGRTIVLDSMANGVVAQQNGSAVALSDGQLKYEKSEVGEPAPTSRGQQSEITYNMLVTPKGRQFQLVLPDGSKVWLNAASSITYPVAFAGKQRNVKITGEAYFEVSKNKEKPFIVDVDGKQTVEVLGTHFNINSYPNEDAIRTTLLEGKVEVRSEVGEPAPTSRGQKSDRNPQTSDFRPQTSAVLSPGQQASLQHNRLTTINNVDLTQITAWKNSLFNFQDLPIKQVMKQLERWYDIQVKYENTIPEIRFRGQMDRGVKMSTMLSFLSDNGIRCKLEGRTLIVTK